MVAADAARSEPEGPYARERLAALQGEIRRAGLRVCGEEYGSPARLAELIHDDLASLIERDFPESAGRDWLEEERAAHGAFAAARRRIYVPPRAALEALDRYAASDSEGIAAVSGPPGAGKSALLANWAAGWRAGCAADVLVEHCCGGSQAGARVPGLLERLAAEICGAFEAVDPPDFAPEPGQEGSEAAQMSRFAGWLTGACAALDRRLVLVPDALDQASLLVIISPLA
eukprot:tig00000113_g5650.t1